ncbi:MAG: xanthine dehydrogenase family protein subunit M [Planctomycetes bacterium]|nr:xanthine dehydrogenase family protein subunit M [Planctomycetota bacterium]
MKSFEFIAPRTLEQAVNLLPDSRDHKSRDRVKLLAGGQDLLGELKDYLIAPKQVVNLKTVPGLSTFDERDGRYEVGALVTLAALERSATLRRTHAMVAEAATAVGSVQIRNQGTVGGNLCQRPRCWYYRHEQAVCIKKGGSECFAYGGLNKYNAILGGGPSYIVHPSDLAPALVAAGASATIQSKKRERTVELERFFTLPSEGAVTRENVLAFDEVLVRIDIPAMAGWTSTYLKFRERSSYDFALAAVALALRMEDGRIAEARLVLGGVAPIPWRCEKAERALVGRKIDAQTCALAGTLALEGAEPLTHNAYKLPLAQGLITKALRKLAGP